MKLQKNETSSTPPVKRQSFLLSKDRYKPFTLAALLLLAVWSICTGTLTLKSSAGDPVVSASSLSNPDDFDVLEVVEREKLVKELWNVYLHGYGGPDNRVRLPRFWEEAFQAAFEGLVSDSPRRPLVQVHLCPIHVMTCFITFFTIRFTEASFTSSTPPNSSLASSPFTELTHQPTLRGAPLRIQLTLRAAPLRIELILRKHSFAAPSFTEPFFATSSRRLRDSFAAPTSRDLPRSPRGPSLRSPRSHLRALHREALLPSRCHPSPG